MVDRAGRFVTANIAYQGVIGRQPVNTNAFTWKLASDPMSLLREARKASRARTRLLSVRQWQRLLPLPEIKPGGQSSFCTTWWGVLRFLTALVKRLRET